MDGLFTFIIIIGIVNSVIKWIKKQQASQNQGNQGAAPDKPWQRMIGDMAKTLEESISGKQPEKTAPVPVYKTLKAPVSLEGTSSGEGSAYPQSVAGHSTPYIAAGEGDASPYSLQSEGASRPQEPLPQWRGNLPGEMEPVSLTAKAADTRLVTAPIQEVAPALNLTFNRDTLLQAVVMHEILTRPQERRRRWKLP